MAVSAVASHNTASDTRHKKEAVEAQSSQISIAETYYKVLQSSHHADFAVEAPAVVASENNPQ